MITFPAKTICHRFPFRWLQDFLVCIITTVKPVLVYEIKLLLINAQAAVDEFLLFNSE